MNHPSEPDKPKPDSTGRPASNVPVIQVDDSRSRVPKTAKAKRRDSGSTRKEAFNAAALSRLMTANSSTNTVTEEDEVAPSSKDESEVGERESPESSPIPDEAAPLESKEIAGEESKPTLPEPITVSSGKASAPRRTAKGGTKKTKAGGGSGVRRIPTTWIALGVCGIATLGVIALLLSLLSGPKAESPSRGRGVDRATGTPRSLPTFQSDLPSAGSSRGGVRPMDAAEHARRREGIDSFADMAREEEAVLRREESQRKP